MNYDELKNFLEKTTDTNEIYQPVIIRLLLQAKKFSLDRTSIEKELSYASGKEQSFFQKSAIYDICGVLERRKAIISDDSVQKFGIIRLNLDEPITTEKEELIQICNYRIIDWEIKHSPNSKIFLIQIGAFGGKTFDQGEYWHTDWRDTKKDLDHGEIHLGDFILFYFSTKALVKEKHKGIIKTFCKVISTESDNAKIKFVKLAEIKGISYEILQSLKNVLKDRAISNPFKNLASDGFNIKNISKDDFMILYDLDKKYKNIFLCSIQSAPAFTHFQNTVIRPQKTNQLDVSSEYKKYSELCIWGTKKTDQYHTHWSKIKKGDMILFFKDYYRCVGILLGTETNKKLAEQLWGKDQDDKTWELIMYILPQNLSEISVEKEKLNQIIPGYTPNAYPRNNNPFYRIKPESTIGMMIHEN